MEQLFLCLPLKKPTLIMGEFLNKGKPFFDVKRLIFKNFYLVKIIQYKELKEGLV